MPDKKVWFSAGRGMGVDIANAVLAADNAAIATGHNINTVSKVVYWADDVPFVKLDITSPARAIASQFGLPPHFCLQNERAWQPVPHLELF